MKPTKRKAFNFLRSYFDVLNELKDDADKLSFLLSIIDKQFLNEDPKDLNFIVKLCYESQRHSIESSVKGWLRVANTDILGNTNIDPPTNPLIDPTTNPPNNPPTNPKEVEDKEEVEVKEKINVDLSIDHDALLKAFNDLTGKKIKIVSDKAKRQLKARLKDGYTKSDIWNAIENCFKDKYHQENPRFLTLEFISRADKMEKYSSDVITKQPIKQDRL